MAKTSRDARRHLAAFTDLFSAGTEISALLINELIKSHKKKKHLRQSLRRLIARGFIEERNNEFKATKVGLKFFRREMVKTFNQESWDGKWYLISFDIPVNKNVKRDRLRRLLKSYEFYPLQKSVWVGPTKFKKDIWEFILENEIENQCKMMLVDVIEGDDDIKKHFSLK